MEGQERFVQEWTKAQPVVSSYLYSMLGDFEAAEDLLQEVAVALWAKFATYDAARPFAAWALGAARLEVLRRRRKLARSFLVFQDDLVESLAETHAELAPELDARSGALRKCLSKVEGRAKELLRLRYEEGLKPAVVAERLGMEAGAARTALSRVRDLLEDCVRQALARKGCA